MEIFFTSDQHYGHCNILKLSNRPFKDIHHMHEELINRWNSVVGTDDIVYNLGDFSMNKKWPALILPRLNGTKILIPGNHDDCFHKEKHIQLYLDSGFHDVYPKEVRHFFDGKPITLCHLPYAGDSGYVDRYKEFRPKDNGELLFHGHVHNTWQVKGRMVNVGVDVHDYYPVTLDHLLSLVSI